MRKGFTLVELSIVLVIIGLLIGGILVAQSMIESAKINKFIKRVSEIDSATLLFKSTYKTLPGENVGFNPNLVAFPNGINGLIGSFAHPGQMTLGHANGTTELCNFFSDLSNTGLRSESGGKYQNCPLTPTNLNLDSTFPKSPLGKNASMVVTADDGVVVDAMIDADTSANYITVVPNEASYDGIYSLNSRSSTSRGPMVKASELAAVDAKLDDGFPLSGLVQAGWCPSRLIVSSKSSAYNGPDEEVHCHNGNSYDFSYSEPKCTPAIRLGGTTGEPL